MENNERCYSRVLHLDRFCAWNMFQNDMTYHVNVPTLTMRAPNPEKFQSLTINPRNIVAENDDKTLNIDNHEIRKTE